jgi:hypothetical protein
MDKTYTTGQMIDMLLENPKRKAKDSDDCGAYLAFNDGVLCWCGDGQNEQEFAIATEDFGLKWTIIEPEPKQVDFVEEIERLKKEIDKIKEECEKYKHFASKCGYFR